MRPRRLGALIVFLFLLVAASVLWWLTTPPVAGPLRLTQVTFADLPDWPKSDPRGALLSFRRSCALLEAKAPSTTMGAYGGIVADWQVPCHAASEASPDSARAYFEQWFVPVSISAGALKDGLFTGYYEPQLHVSRTRRARYRTPIYGLPKDLVSVDLGQFRPALAGERIAGRIVGQKLVPYASRADIDAGGVDAAPVLFYADDPVAAFFLHIQGSGRVVFDDGMTARAAYAGTNGQTYTAIGRTLIAQGALKREDVSLQTIRAWLLAHPDKARAVMESDASFVFFKETPLGDPALGGAGAEGALLTPGASIAVDSRIHPLGLPFYVATTMPASNTPLRRLFVAQDIGGAIRGPVRADIFFGFGTEAEASAGRMKQPGRFYVLLPKPVAARLPKTPS